MKKWMVVLLTAAMIFGTLPVFAASGTICETCNGTGRTVCTCCNGTGMMQAAGVRLFCGSCSGSGQMKCLGKCGGDGVVENGKNADKVQAKGEICQTCNGTGKNLCTWCSGAGATEVAGIRLNCSGCGGTGEMACLGKCGGDGVIEAASESGGSLYFGGMIDSYGGDSACVICKGTGRKACPSCSGSGNQTQTGYAPNFGFGGSTYGMNSRCHACNGSGRVMCTYCLGDGIQ